jgi:TetR/AcrR family transcriptional regulator of autoinduction and epiphytic fitness
MKKRIDRRATRGRWVREQIHEKIVAACIELVRSGIPAPTARETADRAGVSLRAVFNHFPDLGALRREAFDRVQAQSSALLSEEIPDHCSAARRLKLFIEKHARRLEFVAPFHRTAAMVESVDRQVAETMRKARTAAARDLERCLQPALGSFSAGEKRDLLMKLHMICSWGSWEMLRSHYRLSPDRARAIITGAALAVLADAERRPRTRQAALSDGGRRQSRRSGAGSRLRP